MSSKAPVESFPPALLHKAMSGKFHTWCATHIRMPHAFWRPFGKRHNEQLSTGIGSKFEIRIMERAQIGEKPSPRFCRSSLSWHARPPRMACQSHRWHADSPGWHASQSNRVESIPKWLHFGVLIDCKRSMRGSFICELHQF